MGTNSVGCTEWERDFDPMTEQPRQVYANTREEDIAYALLWLRNHYEFGEKPFQADVLDRVDRVLADGPPITGTMGDSFRRKYGLKSDKLSV